MGLLSGVTMFAGYLYGFSPGCSGSHISIRFEIIKKKRHKEQSEELNGCTVESLRRGISGGSLSKCSQDFSNEGTVLRKQLCVRGENFGSREQSKPQHTLETGASWRKSLEPLVCFHSEQ